MHLNEKRSQNVTWWRDSTAVTSNPGEGEQPPRPGGNTRRCLQPHWIFITRQLMNVGQYGPHLRRATAWECRTPFRPRRANIDIDWIKTNIWEGNLASNLKRKFDREQALSFTYVMLNKYVYVCCERDSNWRMRAVPTVVACSDSDWHTLYFCCQYLTIASSRFS